MTIHNSRHLFLKFNKYYENGNIDTMDEHIEIDNSEGSVIWGAFTRSVTANNFEKKKISVLDEQVLKGVPTFVFFYSREEGKIFVADYIEWFSRYEISQEQQEINLIPSYYHDRVGVSPDPSQQKLTCKAYIRISNIREIEESYAKDMFGFEDHSKVIYTRLAEKQNFNVAYINISDKLFELLSSDFSSYVSDVVEIINGDKDKDSSDKEKARGEQVAPPDRTSKKRNKSLRKKKGRKTDYIKLAKSNSKIGSIGEEFILKKLKEELNEKGITDRKVRHVSKKDGDGLGYDILTYDENGKKIFVEVKATTLGKRSPFYMSSYELEFALNNKDQYRIYRVFNLDIKTGIGDYYVIEGNIVDEFNFISDTYRVFR